MRYDIRKYLIYIFRLSLSAATSISPKNIMLARIQLLRSRSEPNVFWQNSTKFESLAAALKFAVNTGWYFRVEGGLVYASVSEIFFIYLAIEMREEFGPI